MIQNLAAQLAARGGQGGGMGGGMPAGGAPAGGAPGNTGVVPPWLAQMRGGNPLGAFFGQQQGGQGGFNPLARFMPQGGQGGAQGGWNPLAALQQRFGMGGQGGTPIIPQGGGQGAGAQMPAPGAQPQTAGLWNPAAWGGGNPNAQAIAQRVQPVAGIAAGEPTPGQPQSRAWDPSSWGAGKPDAQALMHQNMATNPGQPGVTQGAQQTLPAGAHQTVRRKY